MPSKAGIIKDMRDVYGNKSYLSLVDVSRYMGIDENEARKFIKSENVSYIQTGKKLGKRYCISDVAEMIFQLQVRR